MTNTLTPEQSSILKGFYKRLHPAKLKDTPANGLRLRAILEANYRGGTITDEDLYRAANDPSFYRSAEWDIKPAKLLMEESETKVIKVVPARVTDEVIAAQKKVAELQAEQKKADEKFEKETTSLIANYQEINKAGRIAFGAQESHKKRLTEWVAANKGKVSAEGIFKAVQNEINRLYTASEKERERS